MTDFTTIDTRGLESMMNGLRSALIGQGGDVSTIVRDESKRLAVEVSHVSQPQDRRRTAYKIETSVRSKFLEANQSYNLSDHADLSATGVIWYNVNKNFLFGVAPANDMRRADPQRLANLYYQLKRTAGKTRRILDFTHPRKHQKVAIVQKIITSKGVLRKAVAIVQKGIGRLPASWFATAKQLDSSLVAPGWIERHIHGNKTKRSITDMTGLNNSTSPVMAFGSRAAGASKFDRAVQFAVDLRAKKMKARLELVLSGYSKDIAHGIKIKRHAKETQ